MLQDTQDKAKKTPNACISTASTKIQMQLWCACVCVYSFITHLKAEMIAVVIQSRMRVRRSGAASWVSERVGWNKAYARLIMHCDMCMRAYLAKGSLTSLFVVVSGRTTHKHILYHHRCVYGRARLTDRPTDCCVWFGVWATHTKQKERATIKETTRINE